MKTFGVFAGRGYGVRMPLVPGEEISTTLGLRSRLNLIRGWSHRKMEGVKKKSMGYIFFFTTYVRPVFCFVSFFPPTVNSPHKT